MSFHSLTVWPTEAAVAVERALAEIEEEHAEDQEEEDEEEEEEEDEEEATARRRRLGLAPVHSESEWTSP